MGQLEDDYESESGGAERLIHVPARVELTARRHKDARVMVRINRADLDRLKDLHAQTYIEHRLSFNAWIVEPLVHAS